MANSDSNSIMRVLVPLLAGVAGAMFWEMGGFLAGAVLGYLLWERREANRRMQGLEARMETLLRHFPQHAAADVPPVEAPGEAAEAFPSAPVAEPPVAMLPPPVAVPRGIEKIEVPAPKAAAFDPGPAYEAPSPMPAAEPGPASQERVRDWAGAVRSFLFGGNTLVRLGVIVLFFGFVFLVKYAVDHDYFPVELRLAATAAAGIGLAGLGWRLRSRRPDFALALQGGGAAILYLTIFAAYRLYDLVPSSAAFALLVLTTVLCAALALLQNAQSLVILSLLGGFFAPVLASTGEGSHVALFSYYVVLNAAVFLLAWRRPWRALHLVGFFCTFGIAGLWVADRYVPALFGTTEPFLLLFFLLYFGVSILHARHHTPTLVHPVDGTLVFGLPVVVFSLQAVLVDHLDYGLAWSAFGFGLFYAAVAWLLYRRRPEMLRLLVEAFAGIGLVMSTLVLPFALDATWTGTGWALEGAALVWLGLRQDRVRLRLSGMVLQIAAGVAFLSGLDNLGDLPLPMLNRFYLGCLALSLAALATAWLIHRYGDRLHRAEPPAQGVFLTIGMLWWYLGGVVEIVREVSDIDGEIAFQTVVAFTALTALACAWLRGVLDWRALRVPALLLLPLLFMLLLLGAAVLDHPFQAGGFVAWPLAVTLHLVVLRRLDGAMAPWVARVLHGAWLWLAAVVLAWEGTWAVETRTEADTAWMLMALLLPPTLLALLAVRLADREGWPFGAHRWGYLLVGVAPLLAAVWYASLLAVGSSADPTPLPYLSLANPLDLVLGLALVTSIDWFRTSRRTLEKFGSENLRRGLLWLLAATVFVWLNATLARTVHFWAGVPYDTVALLDSTTFQTALTIFWTLLSVATMAAAARRGGRTPWMVAAVLLGITVIKLFAVDLSSISTVARIITFLVVGALLLLVGYLAPVPPPRRAEEGPEHGPPEEPTPA